MNNYTMSEQELIQFVIEEELNVFECYNSDRTEVECHELDASTFLNDNYDMVIQLFNAKNS